MIKSKKIKVSIVIPTYNHCDDFLAPCIESILKNTDDMYELEFIVVANGCTDNTVEYLFEISQEINMNIIWLKDPSGFTIPVNMGLKVASGDFTLILNNDIVILDFWKKDGWLTALIKPFHDDPKTAVTGPVKVFDGSINYGFIVFCMALIPTKLFKEIGYLDERFSPGYGEDIEFCYRAQKAGYKIRQIPKDDVYEYTTAYPVYHKAEGTMLDKEVEWEKIGKEKDYYEVIERNKKQLNEIFRVDRFIGMPETEIKEKINQCIAYSCFAVMEKPNSPTIMLDEFYRWIEKFLDITGKKEIIENILAANCSENFPEAKQMTIDQGGVILDLTKEIIDNKWTILKS